MKILSAVRFVLGRAGARARWWSERGATAVEYAIVAAAIAAVVILGVVFLGEETKGNFDCTKDSVDVQNNQCVPSP